MSDFAIAVFRFAIVVFVQTFTTILATVAAFIVLLGPVAALYAVWNRAAKMFVDWDKKQTKRAVDSAWKATNTAEN